MMEAFKRSQKEQVQTMINLRQALLQKARVEGNRGRLQAPLEP